jgi:hypothetical protein
MNKPLPGTPRDIDAWLAELDRFADGPFMEDGRCQPPMPEPAAEHLLSLPHEIASGIDPQGVEAWPNRKQT